MPKKKISKKEKIKVIEEKNENVNSEPVNKIVEENTSPNLEPGTDKIVEKKYNKQLMWAVILMILIIGSMILVPVFINNYVNKFVYAGLDFEKTNVGKVIFYSTNIPVTDDKFNIISSFSLNLREDPRKLDYITTNISNNTMTFARYNQAYISVEADGPKCEDNIMAVVGITAFLKDFGGMKIKGAISTNETYANETGFPYITCENSPNNTVILIKSSNESSITKIDKNCYELKYKDCEINKVAEKFIMEIVERYMDFFERTGTK